MRAPPRSTWTKRWPAPRWHFVDLQGREVPLEEAKMQLHRLGAILHVAGPASAEADAGTRSYREYVLCNESMVARYRYGGLDLQNRLEDDAALAAHPALGTEREALYMRALAFECSRRGRPRAAA